jgi:hypothetical protein
MAVFLGGHLVVAAKNGVVTMEFNPKKWNFAGDTVFLKHKITSLMDKISICTLQFFHHKKAPSLWALDSGQSCTQCKQTGNTTKAVPYYCASETIVTQ